MIIMQSHGRKNEKRSFHRVAIKHTIFCACSPQERFAHHWRSRKSNPKQWTCCHDEKKARDDFSANAVPPNQQRAMREPDCEMLRLCSLLCSRNGERLPQLTKKDPAVWHRK